MVDKARMREFSAVLSERLVDAGVFAAYCDAVMQAGGMWERLFGGILVVHVPVESKFDPELELDQVIERIRQREAAPPSRRFDV
jgi:hypothetical protein